MSDLLFDTYFQLNTNTMLMDSAKLTLWMGDLDPWMDENFIRQLWLSLGENVVVKLIRDKRTGISSGYAFIGFTSMQAAQRALNTLHGSKIPNSQRTFRLNWASGGGICDRKEDRAPEYSLFVGDLSSDTTEAYLLTLFRQRYPSCHSAKIMTDPNTGLSRGYGFVRFLNQLEQQDAVETMNGILCSNRPIRVSYATPKNNNARYFQLALQAPALVLQPTDANNTTVFVGGLSSPVTEEQLRQCFAPFGEVTYVKIPVGKGCGFVQYVSRASAEQAIEKMNGFVIGSSRIRLSWGRSQADKNLASPSLSNTSHLNTNTNALMTMNNINPLTNGMNQSNDYNYRLLEPLLTSPTITNNPLLGPFQPLSPPQSLYQVNTSHHSLFFQPEQDWLSPTSSPDKMDQDDWHFKGIYA
ncbi:hypothetical protein BDB01DRAFT_528447 [Pilobolus umbonatus]|nr:hypothetical protein BDB01DRAFT_528447 [Pilobolus umbonatus]